MNYEGKIMSPAAKVTTEIFVCAEGCPGSRFTAGVECTLSCQPDCTADTTTTFDSARNILKFTHIKGATIELAIGPLDSLSKKNQPYRCV
jgi:hypothetical protein